MQDDVAIAREVVALAGSLCEAYAQRDAVRLRGLILARSLDAPEGLKAFVNACLVRGQTLAPTDGGGLSHDGQRALASLTVGPPLVEGEPPPRRRPVRLLVARDVDGVWKALGATTEVGLAQAFLAGLWDGLGTWATLPLSAPLIAKAQRVADALMTRPTVDNLAEAVGDPRADARSSLAMLAGVAGPDVRVVPLPCREHPVANRGALGFAVEHVAARATSEFWLLCRTDGPELAVLGTAAHISMGLLLGHAGGEDAKPRRRGPAPVAAAEGSLAGDAFDRAVRRALEDAVATANAPEADTTPDGLGDAFDRAVRSRMADDGDARARLAALFDVLADDRRDATLRELLATEAAPLSEGGGLAAFEALWRDGALVATLRQAVADYVAPFAPTDGKLNVDGDFLATHGEALVGALLGAVLRPMTEALSPDALRDALGEA
jgi:hypothetical protein